MTIQANRKTSLWALLILLVSGLVAAGIAIFLVDLYWAWTAPRDPDRVEFWLYKLEHGDDQWRRSAASILASRVGPPEERIDHGQIQGGEARQADIRSALIEALDGPSPAVRRKAVFGLRNVESARPLIRECLDDPDPEVRRLARGVLDRKFVDQSREKHEADRLPSDSEK